MADFTVTRTVHIEAAPSVVHALVDDFRRWRNWSPWEDVDPHLARSYTGSESGVGARYDWRGNAKAGAGSMEITASEPTRISIVLQFLKPWKATNEVAFTLEPAGTATTVTWTMSGTHRGLGRLFALVMSMDTMVGKDFEKGLARLKQLAEAPAG